VTLSWSLYHHFHHETPIYRSPSIPFEALLLSNPVNLTDIDLIEEHTTREREVHSNSGHTYKDPLLFSHKQFLSF
jgi:hypothetical protein